MGKRRAAAGAIVALVVLALAAVSGPVLAGGGGRAVPAAVTPTLPTLPSSVAAPTVTAPGGGAPTASVPFVCDPGQLHVTQTGVKVALGTIVGSYRVDAGRPCALPLDDSQLLAAIDGGVAATRAVLQSPANAGTAFIGKGSPATVDITYPNPNVQAPPPVPGAPALPGVPPLTVPPTTVPKPPPTTLPGLNTVTAPLGGAVSNVQNLLSPTTTAPPPPPPPPPPDNGPTDQPAGATGFDISWPQCGNGNPPSSTVAVVGVNDGRTFTTNPCLAGQSAWAAGNRQLYVNLNSPTAVDGTDSSGPAGNCAPGGQGAGCVAYNYGYNAAAWSYNQAASQGVRAKMWWLDVEVVGNCAPQFPTGGSGYWSCGQGLNMATVQGALDALRQRGLVAGIYSTGYQWGQITGGATPAGGAAPTWLAGASSASWCSGGHNFAGGSPWLVQFSPNPWDRDQAC